MIKHSRFYSLFLLGFTLAPQMVLASEPSLGELKAEAVSIVKQFGGELKPKLQQAMKTEGPVHAIDVCSKQAPEIADKLTEQTGWQVKRVSLKPRNSKTALADEWETRVLKQFDARQAKGESADTLVQAEIVNGQFRFMKAQAVEAVCMNCHASEINPNVEAKLKQVYPQDQARGYSLGQIRGAFSLAKDL